MRPSSPSRSAWRGGKGAQRLRVGNESAAPRSRGQRRRDAPRPPRRRCWVRRLRGRRAAPPQRPAPRRRQKLVTAGVLAGRSARCTHPRARALRLQPPRVLQPRAAPPRQHTAKQRISTQRKNAPQHVWRQRRLIPRRAASLLLVVVLGAPLAVVLRHCAGRRERVWSAKGTTRTASRSAGAEALEPAGDGRVDAWRDAACDELMTRQPLRMPTSSPCADCPRVVLQHLDGPALGRRQAQPLDRRHQVRQLPGAHGAPVRG